jgi:hypothetical protein
MRRSSVDIFWLEVLLLSLSKKCIQCQFYKTLENFIEDNAKKARVFVCDKKFWLVLYFSFCFWVMKRTSNILPRIRCFSVDILSFESVTNANFKKLFKISLKLLKNNK